MSGTKQWKEEWSLPMTHFGLCSVDGPGPGDPTRISLNHILQLPTEYFGFLIVCGPAVNK